MYNYNYRKSSEPPLSTFYTAYPRDYLARSNSDAENVPFMRSPGPRPGGRKRLNTLEVTSANLTTFLQSTKRGKRKLSLLSNNGEEVLRFGETIREGEKEYVTHFIDNNGEAFSEVTFRFEINVQKLKSSISKKEVPFVNYMDGLSTDSEKATIELNAINLAIISQQLEIVQLILEKAMAMDENTLLPPESQGKSSDHHKYQITKKLLRHPISIEFKDQDNLIRNYSKMDLGLDGMNSFHVAARYCTDSMAKLLEIAQPIGLTEIIETHSRILKQTPLHVAARNANSENTKALLDYDAEVDSRDLRGFTPLHIAAKSGSEANTLTLLEYGADVNAVGKEDYVKTPLHRARTARIVEILLNAGANPYAKMKNKMEDERDQLSAFEVLLARNPNAASKILNHGILTNDQELDSSNLLLIYDLELFRKEVEISPTKDEMSVHAKLIYLKLREMQKHPLAETYLHMKWELSKKFYFMNLYFYSLFTIIFTAFTITSTYILKDCHHDTNSTNSTSHLPKNINTCLDNASEPLTAAFWSLVCLSSIGILLLALREALQATHSWHRYVKEKENILELILVLFAALYTGFLFCDVPVGQHMGAFAVFLCWINMTFLIGRVPTIGIYIYMIAHVMKLLLTILLVYLTSLLAFAFAFHILLPHNTAFDNPLTACIKIIVMMIGEFDFEDNFTWSQVKESGSNFSTQILFVLFVFLASIAVSNLIVGLTVNKTEELFKEAGVIRLEKTALQVMGLEDVLVREKMMTIIPKSWRKNYSKITQLFPFLDAVDEKKVTKICVKPFELKRKNLFMKDSTILASSLISMYENRSYPIYIFEESKGGRGSKLKFHLPGWIVQKTLDTIKERIEMNNLILSHEEMMEFRARFHPGSSPPSTTPKVQRRRRVSVSPVGGNKNDTLKDLRFSTIIEGAGTSELKFVDEEEED